MLLLLLFKICPIICRCGKSLFFQWSDVLNLCWLNHKNGWLHHYDTKETEPERYISLFCSWFFFFFPSELPDFPRNFRISFTMFWNHSLTSQASEQNRRHHLRWEKEILCRTIYYHFLALHDFKSRFRHSGTEKLH